jgi:hypothetical protein
VTNGRSGAARKQRHRDENRTCTVTRRHRADQKLNASPILPARAKWRYRIGKYLATAGYSNHRRSRATSIQPLTMFLLDIATVYYYSNTQ